MIYLCEGTTDKPAKAHMQKSLRFGRKIPLPSTTQIKHELRMMIAADALIAGAQSALADQNLSAEETTALVNDLSAKHGFSHQGADMLVRLVRRGIRSPESLTALR